MLYKKIMPGNMHFNFSNFIFNIVNYIIKF